MEIFKAIAQVESGLYDFALPIPRLPLSQDLLQIFPV